MNENEIKVNETTELSDENLEQVAGGFICEVSPGHWVIGNDETGLILGPADDRQDALEQANRFRLLLREIDVKTLKEIQVRNDPKQAEVEGIQF